MIYLLLNFVFKCIKLLTKLLVIFTSFLSKNL